MRKTVRFIEDDTPYSAGDFGDEGEQVMRAIERGETMVVGMIVFDADAVSDDETIAYETRVSDAGIDSLWNIDVPSAAIDDCDRDVTDPTTVHDEYLRHLATEALSVDEPETVTVTKDDLRLLVENFSWPGPHTDEVDAAWKRLKDVVR